MKYLPMLLSGTLSICGASAAQAQDKPVADMAANRPVGQGTAQAESRKVPSVNYWAAIGQGLEGIEKVYLEMDCHHDPGLGTASEASLRTTIEPRCKAAGLKIVQSKSPHGPSTHGT